MQDIRKGIIELLREELPQSLMPDVDEIELLIAQNKNRQAYLRMYEIKKNPLWSPPSKYLHLIELFWWNFAN